MDKNKDINCCVTACETPLDQNYWNAQWEAQSTGWDIGYAAPAIVDYISNLEDKSIAILIPGCGNAYEAEYLLQNGFTNITLIDIAPKAVEILQQKFKENIAIKVLCEDFFMHKGSYDLIIEQTFFCAIPPVERSAYAKKMAELLSPKGKLIGLLFDRTFDKQGPPFGGCPCEYKPIFEPSLDIIQMEITDKSIPQRAGTELFIEMQHK